MLERLAVLSCKNKSFVMISPGTKFTMALVSCWSLYTLENYTHLKISSSSADLELADRQAMRILRASDHLQP